tara:strand:+ start:136 stop:378 length:243 start_codon:yes stop_codon:yes gene_type:complete
MLLEIFSEELLKSVKVVRSKKRSRIKINDQLSPRISRQVLTGHEERLSRILIFDSISVKVDISISLIHNVKFGPMQAPKK